ncbi:MAG: acyl-CoA dehydrogenase, partial [Rhodospirillaceae bacterium]|nr:acyl-CoA dehydrogenase [Rhodospirillaceae bacterium]
MNAPPAADAGADAAILDAIDRFVERSILPVAHDLEAKDEYPHGIVED